MTLTPDDSRPSAAQSTEQIVRDILREAKTIAVVGLSSRPNRPSHEVARYLQQQGYRIVPVNPREASVLGEKSYPSLRDVPFHVDLVDVFRRAEDVPLVARDAVAIGADTLWLQLGIFSAEAERIAREGGLRFVENLCTKVEHARLRSQGIL